MSVKSRNVPSKMQSLFPLTPTVVFIVLALAAGAKHGYAIMQEVADFPDHEFRMGPRTLWTEILISMANPDTMHREADEKFTKAKADYRLLTPTKTHMRVRKTAREEHATTAWTSKLM
jgi:hypothetical protein